MSKTFHLATHRSDLDGICSAALVIRAFQKKKVIVKVDYLTIAQTKNNTVPYDLVTDLPKMNGKRNLDHHSSNLENLQKTNRLSKQDIVDPSAPAAVELVFKDLKMENDLIAQQIREIGVLADTANLPDEYIILDHVIKGNLDKVDALHKLALLLAEHGNKIIQHPWVKEQYESFQKEIAKAQQVIKEALDKVPNAKFLLVDSRAFSGKFNKQIFPIAFQKDVKVVAAVFIDTVDNLIGASFRVGKPWQDQYDVKEIAERLGGGGHPMASATRSTDGDWLYEQVYQELQKLAERTNEKVQIVVI